MYLWNIGVIGWQKDINLAYLQYNLNESFFNGWGKGRKSSTKYSKYNWSSEYLDNDPISGNESFANKWNSYADQLIATGQMEVIKVKNDNQ